MKYLAWALLACTVASPVVAQTAPVSSIRVSGDSQVTVKPDRVQIDIGVTTHGEASTEAASQNARQVDAVIAAVKKSAGPTAVLKTVNYSLQPSYKYQNGHEPMLTGYNVSNVVQVQVDDLTKTSSVIDAAAQAGANNVRGISYTLRDQDGAHADALRKAVARARADAEVLASALNLRVLRVLSVEETGQRFVPMMRSMAAAPAAAAAEVATPVESGTLEISASVVLTVEVGPAAR